MIVWKVDLEKKNEGSGQSQLFTPCLILGVPLFSQVYPLFLRLGKTASSYLEENLISSLSLL